MIVSTIIHRVQPAVAFNAHRIYTCEMLRSLCKGVNCLKEKFHTHQEKRFYSLAEVTTDPKRWDVYLGC